MDGVRQFSVWMTRDEMCEKLGCSKRTLARKVGVGEVERHQEGRRAFYRATEGWAPKEQKEDKDARQNAESAPEGMARVVSDLVERLAELQADNERMKLELAEAHCALDDAEVAWMGVQVELLEARAAIKRQMLGGKGPGVV